MQKLTGLHGRGAAFSILMPANCCSSNPFLGQCHCCSSNRTSPFIHVCNTSCRKYEITCIIIMYKLMMKPNKIV
ncbi:Os03g0135550 [Oryza sativa Japonica Group]|uniref:Os03g0135550 protein n=1 Tax=Oryza sativa subsp. japonica TaxID=39947 RepID=A0A0P0VSS7_ORYSJ|nr:hypothetical protein EE612_015160 [Oryza sativa]BAS82178.1 Os03g0135550 [Oryza sativa Japonica Group]